ncbi:MAG: hypothetical protein K2N24_04475 [Lachnospiraceae bacterium]|nr:hypothetical protein [Lachnospiraceae bacterium]
MKNKEYYQGTFDEVHVPEAVLGKVKGMKMEEKKIQKKSKLRYAAAIAAAFGLCIVASNGICYAATGNTWVEKVILYINGEAVEQDITWHQDGDLVYGEFEYQVDGEEPAVVEFYNSEDTQMEIKDGAEYEECNLTSEILQENDRLYLSIGDSKIDITEDFADGECSGTFEFQGVTFEYELSGTVDNYTVDVR